MNLLVANFIICAGFKEIGKAFPEQGAAEVDEPLTCNFSHVLAR